MDLKKFAAQYGLYQEDKMGSALNKTDIVGSSPRPSVASILSERRQAPSPAPQRVGVVNTPTPMKTAPVADPDIVEHFHNVANRSTMPGFNEFVTQVRVLGKHIHDENALYAAVLDSVQGSDNITREAVVSAIEDRIHLVMEEKNGALKAHNDEKDRELSANQSRVGEINSTTETLHAEIAEKEQQIRQLDSEKNQLASKLSETAARYDEENLHVAAAADQVLQELNMQANKLRSRG